MNQSKICLDLAERIADEIAYDNIPTQVRLDNNHRPWCDMYTQDQINRISAALMQSNAQIIAWDNPTLEVCPDMPKEIVKYSQVRPDETIMETFCYGEERAVKFIAQKFGLEEVNRLLNEDF